MYEKNTKLKAEVKVNEACKKARWIWLDYFKESFKSFLLALVIVIEFELIYRTFQAIAGKDNQYWSPPLMAMTGVIMIAAFHLLGRGGSDNPAVRFVKSVSPYLVCIYVVGLGLLASGIVSFDAGSMILTSPADIIIGGLPDSEPEQHWLQSLFQNITNPLALALFSIGIGGLSIVNLFVAHELSESVWQGVQNIRDIKSEADRLAREYQTAMTCEERYRELQFDKGDAALWSDDRIMREAAMQISAVIHDALGPHKRFIKNHRFSPEPGEITIPDPIDPKPIDQDIKKIEALDMKAIHKILQSHTNKED